MMGTPETAPKVLPSRLETEDDLRPVIAVGYATCGLAVGAREVYAEFERALEGWSSKPRLTITGCNGMCYHEPLVEVRLGDEKGLYGKVTAERVPEILAALRGGRFVTDWLVGFEGLEPEQFLAKQRRIAFRNCGSVNPEEIEDYVTHEGYSALRHVLTIAIPPEQIIRELAVYGLRGRARMGYPVAVMWDACRKAPGEQKYVICNASESDPDAYGDRNLIESDPHSLLEGMILAGYTVGADEGIVYCHSRHPLAIRRLRMAVHQAVEHGLLGGDILDSGFNFTVTVQAGTDAFVCGEEAALIASMEGHHATQAPPPSFPAGSGLKGRPTVVANVETLAAVPWIIVNGAVERAERGPGRGEGTKLLGLGGRIKRYGLVEVPMGTTLREVIDSMGGGVEGGKAFKAVRVGGPTGTLFPEELLDTPIHYQSLSATGALLGSGGLFVMDEDSCIVDATRASLRAIQDEALGQCPPCRSATSRMLEILTRIGRGEGAMEDLDTLERLGYEVGAAAFCSLGGTAPGPVLSSLMHFRDEYEEHIRGMCPAGVCAELS